MKFDKAAVAAFLASLDPTGAATVASLAGFAIDIYQWVQSKRASNQQATLDGYLEWKRRQDHGQLVDLVLANREVFEKLIMSMNDDVVGEIKKLNESQQRRHDELTDYRVLANRMRINVRDPFTAESFQNRSQWQDQSLRAKFVIVNQNQSKVTIRSALMEVEHPEHSFRAQMFGEQTGIEIDGGGSSKTIRFMSIGNVKWREGEEYIPVSLSLEVEQESSSIDFVVIDGHFTAKP